MSVWMDLTNSLHTWKGGVVGIIRAELEIAKNIIEYMPDIKFCKFNGHAFEEISHEQLCWLFSCQSVGDAYIQNVNKLCKDNKKNITNIDNYPGLNEAFAYSNKKSKRFYGALKEVCKSFPGFVRIPIKYLYKFTKKNSFHKTPNKKTNNNDYIFSYPFKNDDLVFSCGWMYSGKEEAYSQVKKELKKISIVYLIYDIILLLEDTKRFYSPIGSEDFKNYLRWASYNCCSLIYGGETAKRDTINYQQKQYWPVLDGYPVKFGSNIVNNDNVNDYNETDNYLKKIGINKEYLIAVGSLDKRKNYDTLYRAFAILGKEKYKYRPQLVIVGKGDACPDLTSLIKEDPYTINEIIMVSPSDKELNILYKNAKFALLASAYEGWSLTLPEALNYNKFVLVSDVDPLREVGKDFIDYCDTYDPYDWAKKISYYCEHTEIVKQKEDNIKKGWNSITWNDCSKQIADYLITIKNIQSKQQQISNLYLDISLTVRTAVYGGDITGIGRTELMMIRYLCRKDPKLKLFSMCTPNGFGYLEFDKCIFSPLIEDESVDSSFNKCKSLIINFFWSHKIVSKENNDKNYTKHEIKKSHLKKGAWLLISCFSQKTQNKVLAKIKLNKDINKTKQTDNIKFYDSFPFSKDDVVFTAVGQEITSSNYHDFFYNLHEERHFKYCCIIYDFTPIKVPQTHTLETKNFYKDNLEINSEVCDLILYGGKTAQSDGVEYFKNHNYKVVPSFPIYFGSDFTKNNNIELNDDKKFLKSIGIKGKFILAVGTIQVRKNYETLYRAYLRLLEKYGDDVPQLIFAGHVGWRAGNFIETMLNDDRIKGKLLFFSPSDFNLDILYRNCSFTVLASLYEGWSLTLPESMQYGKFCLCCNTPSLIEVAGDLSEYVDAYDEVKWAERIYYYYKNPAELAKKEKAIHDNWHAITWKECADQVFGYLEELRNESNEE